uniref:Gamma-gliadin-like n=1 Tax=Dermatophagoides pteronyssinus TaxID=6956 RepID=A0A6P6XTF9_DERPT
MSHSLSKYVNYNSSPPQPSPPQPSPPQPQRSWPNYFNLSYQQPQSHHQYNQDVLTHRPANPFGRPPATTKMSHSLSKYVNYKPSPPQPQRPWPNYFNLSYQQPQSHHQYNQDVLTHRPANPFGRPPYPEQQQYSH